MRDRCAGRSSTPSASTSYPASVETARETGGLALDGVVHAFRRWDGELAEAWCGSSAEVPPAVLTTALIRCRDCKNGSWAHGDWRGAWVPFAERAMPDASTTK